MHAEQPKQREARREREGESYDSTGPFPCVAIANDFPLRLWIKITMWLDSDEA